MSDDINIRDQIAIAQNMQRIAKMIDEELSKATGGKRVPFSLYTWGGHRSQYVGNAPREQVRRGMEETLERWDQDDGPLHKAN